MRDIEIRKTNSPVTREDDSSRIISGKAVSFDTPSQDLGFTEYIHREAISQELIDSCDIFAKFNHDDNKILARSRKGKGSLKLDLRDDGLYYSFKAKKTALGDEVLAYIEDGDLEGSSFAFYVSDEPNSEVWTRDMNGSYKRDIYKIGGLADVSPVFEPAYLDTNVKMQSRSKTFQDIQERAMKIDSELDSKLKEIEDL